MSKKETIIKAATELFATNGFERTSVRKIAEEVNLSVPGMFHYFPSKEDILNEIMIGFMDEGYARLEEIYNSDLGPVEKLEEVCKCYVEYYAGHKDQLTILVSEAKSLSSDHQQIFIKKQRIYVEALKRLFSDLAKDGLLKTIDPSVLAFIFFGMVHWTYNWYNPRGKIGPEVLGAIFSEVFPRGVLKDHKEIK
ncbi:MAG: TetR family transcriptional regulator [Deltaproteobacteria bacterium]|nr:TetR family transcriptional regulator [Deltaproteobacteria bacterium]